MIRTTCKDKGGIQEGKGNSEMKGEGRVGKGSTEDQGSRCQRKRLELLFLLLVAEEDKVQKDGSEWKSSSYQPTFNEAASAPEAC